jgi:hypothetical protein
MHAGRVSWRRTDPCAVPSRRAALIHPIAAHCDETTASLEEHVTFLVCVEAHGQIFEDE